MTLSFAQEIQTDTLGVRGRLPEILEQLDTVRFTPAVFSNEISLPKTNIFSLADSALIPIRTNDWKDFLHDDKPSKSPPPIFPLRMAPHLTFTVVPSRWDLPLLGNTTTFAPTLTYHLSDKMALYGGAAFTQYHHLSYIQSRIAPGFPVKSNITSQAFGGFAYALHDRITLHGTYQHSLYNQMPSNLISWSPAYNAMSVGADLDIWNGLGVSVDRVWEWDKSGRKYQYMRYSPYINMDKFLKFLGIK